MTELPQLQLGHGQFKSPGLVEHDWSLVMVTANMVAIAVGALVALAVLAVAAFVVGKLSKKNATVIAAVLLALATLVATFPAVIRSFQPESASIDPPAVVRTVDTQGPDGPTSPSETSTAKYGR